MTTTSLSIDQVLYTAKGDKHLVMGVCGNVCFVSHAGKDQHKYYRTVGVNELNSIGLFEHPVCEVWGLVNHGVMILVIPEYILDSCDWTKIYDGYGFDEYITNLEYDGLDMNIKRSTTKKEDVITSLYTILEIL